MQAPVAVLCLCVCCCTLLTATKPASDSDTSAFCQRRHWKRHSQAKLLKTYPGVFYVLVRIVALTIALCFSLSACRRSQSGATEEYRCHGTENRTDQYRVLLQSEITTRCLTLWRHHFTVDTINTSCYNVIKLARFYHPPPLISAESRLRTSSHPVNAPYFNNSRVSHYHSIRTS